MLKKPKAPNPPIKPRKFYELAEDISFGWEQELDLNKLIKMVPKGIKRKDIRFKVTAIGEGDNCKMYLTASYVGKYHNPDYEVHLIEYKNQLNNYQIELASYKKNLSKYNSAVLKSDIAFFKKELKRLQQQLKRLEKDE